MGNRSGIELKEYYSTKKVAHAAFFGEVRGALIPEFLKKQGCAENSISAHPYKKLWIFREQLVHLRNDNDF